MGKSDPEVTGELVSAWRKEAGQSAGWNELEEAGCNEGGMGGIRSGLEGATGTK